MDVSRSVESQATPAQVEEIPPQSDVKVEISVAGEGYVRIGTEYWVYLRDLTSMVLGILDKNPNASEEEIKTGEAVARNLKSFCDTAAELENEGGLVTRTLSCRREDANKMMQSLIKNKIGQSLSSDKQGQETPSDVSSSSKNEPNFEYRGFLYESSR